jgi:type I restriction enzyme R subunit
MREDLEFFSSIPWKDIAGMNAVIRQKIPDLLAYDTAYQNAREHSDPENTRVEAELAIKRVVSAILADHIELFQQFTQNPEFRRWLTSVVLKP